MILESLLGLFSTYPAVVLIDECPANVAMLFKSTPASASLVIIVRLPECELPPSIPAKPCK
jgi:hypothetical protein